MTEEQTENLRRAMDAVNGALADLSTPHRIGVIARLLGCAACEPGPNGSAPEKFTAHSRLGQAMGSAFKIVDEHFRGIE